MKQNNKFNIIIGAICLVLVSMCSVHQISLAEKNAILENKIVVLSETVTTNSEKLDAMQELWDAQIEFNSLIHEVLELMTGAL